MVVHRNKFIDDMNLSEVTSLTHLLDKHDADDLGEEVHIIKHSPYYGEKQFSKLLNNKPGLCILDLNIANIFTKFDLFKSFIERVNISNYISAICLNECWIKEDSHMSGLDLPNYQMFFQRGNRVGHGHCGLVIYVHEQFQCKEIFINQEHTDWDFLCLEISHYKPNSKKYLLCNIYRLPGLIVDDFCNFIDEFSSFLSFINNLRHSTYICGDYNIDLLQIQSNHHLHSYFETILSKGFFPHITLPTRLSAASNFTCNTLIDNILTNNIDEFSTVKPGILINDISDHKMIFIYIENYNYVKKVDKFIEIEKKDNLSHKRFIDELKSLNICDQLNQPNGDNLQENYETFMYLLNYAKELHLPRKKVKYNKNKHKKSKWMTDAILNSIKTRDQLYKALVQTDLNNDILYNTLKHEFKTYRAALRKSIREAKRQHYVRTFNIFKNDIKKTWSIIRENISNNYKINTPVHFVANDNNSIISDSETIANKFNEYFVNIGRTLSEQIRPTHSYNEYLNDHVNTRLTFNSITEDHILNIINKLKNKASYGHDNISNKLLKRAKEVLLKPLTILINQMLTTSKFPSELKKSKVKPLFKSGENTSFSNYRPISLLPSISKIFENVIFYQLMEYFITHNLFCIEQFGFRPGHSTELAALRLVDHLTKQMDEMKIPINIYIDLSKAFDTLDHTILLSKLRYYGIYGKEYDLFQSYLVDRCQYVEYNGSISATLPITTGVPQGSILGPLLFIIYINDLPLVSQVFDMLIYADDTTLICNLDQLRNEPILNLELSKINDWMSSNKLSLNIKKTKYMIYHTNQRHVTYPSLRINNIEIERVTQFNFLGLILNTQLTWKHHIDHISIKISKIIGVIYRLKDIYPQTVLLMLYNTLILSHITYCLLCWGSKIVKDHPLHLLQKKALRLITNSDYVSHSEIICKKYGLLRVPDIFRFTLWKFYFKLMNNNLPYYFNIIRPELPAICNYYEIRTPRFHLPDIKHTFAEQQIKYQLIKLLNMENCSITITGKVHTHSFQNFKYFVKNSIIDFYIDQCERRNCYSCNRMLN